MAKGWHQESARHALASKGVKSAKNQSAQVMAKSSKNSRINEAMNSQPKKKGEFDDFIAFNKKANKELGEDAGFDTVDIARGNKFTSLSKMDEGNLKKARDFLIKNGRMKDARRVHIELDEGSTFDSYLKKKHPSIDSDGDGLINKNDCVPSDPNKQGTIHDKRKRDIEMANGEIQKFKNQQVSKEERRVLEERLREKGKEQKEIAKDALKDLKEKGHDDITLKDAEESVRKVDADLEKSDTSTFTPFEEKKFNIKQKIPFIKKPSPQDEAKELRTLNQRKIARVAKRVRIDEIRELEAQEELAPLEEENLELKKELHEKTLENENERLREKIDKAHGGSLFNKGVAKGKDILTDFLEP